MQPQPAEDGSITLRARDEAATGRVARALAHVAMPGDALALRGALGSGKTAFARAFVRALAGEDEEVPSPTFTLAQSYPAGDTVIHHFDFYRIESPDEAWEIGIEEAFADGIVLIEWPDRIAPLLPGDRLDVYLDAMLDDGETARRITLRPGPSWTDRLAALRLAGDDGPGGGGDG